MKIERNKMIFGSLLLVIVLFIAAYTMMVIEQGDRKEKKMERTEVPRLQEQQKEYTSKLEAVDNIKEERPINAPSVYDERYLDSTGMFDPDFMDNEKQRIVDSIYSQGRIDYSQSRYRDTGTVKIPQIKIPVRDSINTRTAQKDSISAQALALEHQLFFASAPRTDLMSYAPDIKEVHVEVEGDQVVKANSRLRMRLLQEITFGARTVPRNTLIYGTVSFGPNRTLIKIDNIDHIPVKLKAFDLQDGLEGIYVENSFRGEVTNEVVGDLVEDINITGVPQVSGIKKIFQRSNRSVKVAVANNYRLILKAYTPNKFQFQ